MLEVDTALVGANISEPSNRNRHLPERALMRIMTYIILVASNFLFLFVASEAVAAYGTGITGPAQQIFMSLVLLVCAGYMVVAFFKNPIKGLIAALGVGGAIGICYGTILIGLKYFSDLDIPFFIWAIAGLVGGFGWLNLVFKVFPDIGNEEE